MTVSQIITFTAIPRLSLNDEAETLPVSVFISPRLSGEDKLGAYQDWLHWTKKLHLKGLRITFECNGQTLTVEAPCKKLHPELWEALFNEKTLISSHHDDYSDRSIVSYSMRSALSTLKATYQAVGIDFAVPTFRENPMMDFSSCISGYDVNYEENSEEENSEEENPNEENPEEENPNEEGPDIVLMREETPNPTEFPDPKELYKMQHDVAKHFAAFNNMPLGAPLKRESLNEKTVLDFHKVLTSLNTYSKLQRMLGLVFDLELPSEFIATTQGKEGMLRIVKVDGCWNSNTLTTIPVTSTAYVHAKLADGKVFFATAPRNLINPEDIYKTPGEFGLLNLNSGKFGLAQVDVDGGLHKNIILAEIMRVYDSYPAPQHPEVFDHRITLPSLRSGGISLFEDGRALTLHDKFQQSEDVFYQALVNNKPLPTFYAEDLVKGYRLDIWEEGTNKWHSLHRRHGTYVIGNQKIRTEDEEGFVQLAVTQVAPNEDGTCSSDYLYLHEALARWSGWSLSVDRPGKHLTRSADPERSVPNPYHPDPENEPITPFKLATKFQVVCRSLPSLRFGGRYRLRARKVDLAGNSIKLNEPITELLTPTFSLPSNDKTFPYLRFEPVSSPFIVLRDERGVTGEGSSIDRIVIRTFNNDPSLDVAAADLTAADRHIVPPRGSVELGERHGMFDDDKGKLISSADMWPLIKKRDEGKFNEVQLDSMVIKGEKLSVPLEPCKLIDTLPYLPDPLSRGAAFRNLPSTQEGTIAKIETNTGLEGPIIYEKLDNPKPRPGSATLISFGGSTNWRQVKAFRLALDDGNKPPIWDPAKRLLTVFLPKGQTKVVSLSSYMNNEDLKLMGIWQWLRERIEFITTCESGSELDEFGRDHIVHILQLAVEGGHCMLTPPQLLTLVHAVQQPIGRPSFTRLNILLDRRQNSIFEPDLQKQPESIPTDETELDILTSWRKLGSTDSYLIGGLQVHGSSTAKIDIHADWIDFVDDKDAENEEKGYREQTFSTFVEEVSLGNLESTHLISSDHSREVGLYDSKQDLICFVPQGYYLENFVLDVEPISMDTAPRHQIGDTKHHVIKYTAVATSRYKDYFAPKEGNCDRDFTRKSEPVTVHVPASARPAAPQVLYVLPTFGWQRETQTNQQRSVRMGGGLRVYLDRPWYSSGVGELLGVSLLSSSYTTDEFDREKLKPFITQWGQDPIWKSNKLTDFPREYQMNFTDAVIHEESLPLETKIKDNEVLKVDIYGYDVAFDNDRKLWYCDLTVDTQTSTYAPFVRLALVRYQPHALIDAKISSVVLTDFVQLTPERSVTVTADPYQPGKLRVVVSGLVPQGPVPDYSKSDHTPTTPVDRPTVITVTVQERDQAVQSDLGWQDVTVIRYKDNPPSCLVDKTDHTCDVLCDPSIKGDLARRDLQEGTFAVCIEYDGLIPKNPNLALWAGNIYFRQPLKPNQYRLLIQEIEYISADYAIEEEQGNEHVFKQPGRLIFAETILLDDSLLNGPAEKLVAAFTANVTSGTAPLNVLFTDTSTCGVPTSWYWDFGDGITSRHDHTATHTFTKRGVYTVSLTVKNAVGSNTVKKVGYITVHKRCSC